MAYTQLLEPFMIEFSSNNCEYRAKVTYVKSVNSCNNFFHVVILSPAGHDDFYLKEKPTPGSSSNEMLWTDERDKITLLYQAIGTEIEKSLRKDMGIFLIDAPAQHHDNDSVNAENRE